MIPFLFYLFFKISYLHSIYVFSIPVFSLLQLPSCPSNFQILEPFFNYYYYVCTCIHKYNLLNSFSVDHIHMCVKDSRSLCSQINTRETRNVKHIWMFLQRKRCIISFLPRILGMDEVNNLVISVLSVWPDHIQFSQILYVSHLPQNLILSTIFSVNLQILILCKWQQSCLNSLVTFVLSMSKVTPDLFPYT